MSYAHHVHTVIIEHLKSLPRLNVHSGNISESPPMTTNVLLIFVVVLPTSTEADSIIILYVLYRLSTCRV